MHCARSAFGCSLSKKLQVLVVAGGQINASIATNRCEIYDIRGDQWTEIPPMRDAKCSNSLCFKGDWVYAVGGLVRANCSVEMSNKIERLHLKNLNLGWQLLNVQLEEGGVDFGTVIR